MIIVTGGAGFIGSAVAWKLNIQGREDLIIVDHLETSENWRNLVSLKYDQYIEKNHFLSQLLSGKLPKIDGIIHMGACSATTEQNMDYLMENNVQYTQILMEWCIQNKVRFIYASSAATYGNGEHGFNDDHAIIPKLKPINRYGYSKQLVDEFALKRSYLNHCVGLKFFNVYGPNEYHKGDMKSIIAKAYTQIKETGNIKLFKSYKSQYPDGGQMRDFVYVKDCVDAIWWLLNTPSVNGIYNIGTGQSRTWNDLAAAVFNSMNYPIDITYIEMPDSIKNQYQYYTEASMQKLIDKGYPHNLTSLEAGVADYVHHYLSQQFAHLSV